MAKDEDYRRMIHSERWRALRRQVLNAHPLCERCKAEGYVTAATEVHHVTPVEDGVSIADKERLMFDPYNLRALCRRCHTLTHTEIGMGGVRLSRRRNGEHISAAIRGLFGDQEQEGGHFFKTPPSCS